MNISKEVQWVIGIVVAGLIIVGVWYCCKPSQVKKQDEKTVTKTETLGSQ